MAKKQQGGCVNKTAVFFTLVKIRKLREGYNVCIAVQKSNIIYFVEVYILNIFFSLNAWFSCRGSYNIRTHTYKGKLNWSGKWIWFEGVVRCASLLPGTCASK